MLIQVFGSVCLKPEKLCKTDNFWGEGGWYVRFYNNRLLIAGDHVPSYDRRNGYKLKIDTKRWEGEG